MQAEISGRVILIVDDEEWFAETLADGVRAELTGVEVTTANDGLQALGILNTRPIDLVVTDVNMPKMDGLALIAEMMTRQLRVPVIMVTAFGTRGIEVDARKHGVVAVVDKPIDFMSVVDLCATTLRSWSRGVFEGVTLTGLLQLLEMERRTCIVRVFAGNRHGTVSLRNGDVVACTTPGRKGVDALAEIVGWPDPRIEFSPLLRVDPDEQPIPLRAALLESARRSDEARRDLGVPMPLDGLFDEEEDFSDLTPISPHPVLSELPSKDGQAHPNSDVVRRIVQEHMADIESTLKAGMDLPGSIAMAIVDYESGMALGQRATDDFPIEVAAAGNTEVVRAKARVMNQLGIEGGIDDMLITLRDQYHLIVPLRGTPWFIYSAIDRGKGNLALARHKLTELGKALKV